MSILMRKSISMPSPEKALPGRTTPMPVPEKHFVNGHPLKGPFPPTIRIIAGRAPLKRLFPNHDEIRKGTWNNFNELKKDYPNASIAGNCRAVFRGAIAEAAAFP